MKSIEDIRKEFNRTVNDKCAAMNNDGTYVLPLIQNQWIGFKKGYEAALTSIRAINEITSEEDGFRLIPSECGMSCKYDFVMPEPCGTILLLPFKVTKYVKDCDGSALANLVNLYLYSDNHAEYSISDSGWAPNAISLTKGSGVVISEDKLIELLKKGK